MVANAGCSITIQRAVPWVLWHSSKCHTCCLLGSFWVSLSTHTSPFPQPLPQPPRGKLPWARGLFCPLGQRRAGRWPCCSCLGPREEGIKGRPCGPLLSSPSFKEVQTNPVPMPGAAAAPCLWPQPVLLHLLLFPRKKTGPQSWFQGTQSAMLLAEQAMSGRGHCATKGGLSGRAKVTETLCLHTFPLWASLGLVAHASE